MKLFCVIMEIFFYCKIMPSFFFYIWYCWKNYSFFAIGIRNISWTYFYFFDIKNIKSNCWIILLKSCSIFLFWWTFYSIPVIFITNGLIFETVCGNDLVCDLMQLLQRIESIILIFFGFIVVFFFFIQSRESIY